jgi:uncharacterized membrane protein
MVVLMVLFGLAVGALLSAWDAELALMPLCALLFGWLAQISKRTQQQQKQLEQLALALEQFKLAPSVNSMPGPHWTPKPEPKPEPKPAPELEPELEPEYELNFKSKPDPWLDSAVTQRPLLLPAWLLTLKTALWNWLVGGNTLLRVGAVLLFLGLAFLLRYAAGQIVVPLVWRYIGVAVVALVLIGLGWRWRARPASYGLVLQGTGIALLYLSLFAAVKLQPWLSASSGFAGLLLVVLAAAMLAVLQDAFALAVAAALGGFATPILVSTGSGSPVLLLSYLLVLNVGILAIAWFKAWRLLNLIGFIGTFSMGGAWAWRSYQASDYASTQAFLMVFFVLYLVIGWLFSLRSLQQAKPPKLQSSAELTAWARAQASAVDGSLIFGPPLIGFGLHYQLVAQWTYAASYSALGLGMLYLGLAYLLFKKWPDYSHLLMQAYLAIGVIFVSLSIPLALDNHWTSAAWAIEGAGIFWLALVQRRAISQGFALLLQLAAIAYYLNDVYWGVSTVLAAPLSGALMLVAALAVDLWVLRRYSGVAPQHKLESVLAVAIVILLGLCPALLFAQSACLASWAVLGLLAVIVGLKGPWPSCYWAGLAIQGLALVWLSAAAPLWLLMGWFSPTGWFSTAVTPLWPLIELSGVFVAQLILAVSLFTSACLSRPTRAKWAEILLCLALVAWLWGWSLELRAFATGWLGVSALTTGVFAYLARRISWPRLDQLAALQGPIAVMLLWNWQSLSPNPAHPLAGWGAGLWLLAIAAQYYVLRLSSLSRLWLARLHRLSLWLVLGLAQWELTYWSNSLAEGWAVAAQAVVPVLYLMWIQRYPTSSWPWLEFQSEYRVKAVWPMVLLTWGWLLVSAASVAGTTQFVHIPLLNPLELMQILCCYGLWNWLIGPGQQLPWLQTRPQWFSSGCMGLSLCWWFSALVCRALSRYADIPFQPQALWQSSLVQASLSLVWALVALILMLLAQRQRQRGVWIAGALLVVAVVGKLFLVELADSGSLARILSFIGVGLLLLVVGYFAPLPPKKSRL